MRSLVVGASDPTCVKNQILAIRRVPRPFHRASPQPTLCVGVLKVTASKPPVAPFPAVAGQERFYRKLPQKRWMRVQASSSALVAVA
jgi:hypothetical protein